MGDELDDFIEEDEFSDDDNDRLRDEREVGRPGRRAFNMSGLLSGLDDRALEDYQAAFGDGTEYEWATREEAKAEAEQEADKPLELKDIFEPAQLAAKMLTDEDIHIRDTDIPERLQLAWKGITPTNQTEEEQLESLREEAIWIAKLMLPKKRFGPSLRAPFEAAVMQTLKFLNNDFFEVPFIFQHRRDYFIYEHQPEDEPGTIAERLISQPDLWEIFEHDIRFKGLREKRQALRRTYQSLQDNAQISDSAIDSLLPEAVNAEEVQDIQDYMHFQYSSHLKDIQLMQVTTNGHGRRPRAAKDRWETIRASKIYSFVRAIGMTSDDFAKNVAGEDARVYTEDSTDRPDDLADSLLDPPTVNTSSQLLKTARAMFVEELSTNPRMRKFMRKSFYELSVIDCHRTKKGAIEITDDHRYHEFKYLRGVEISAIARKPDSFLRMLKAEDDGLIEIKFRVVNVNSFRQRLYSHIETDNFSDAADAWNALRREWIDAALDNLERITSRGVKEALRTECENNVARACRDKYSEKIDRAPFKPPGLLLGQSPSVIALSSGHGVPGRDAVVWVFLDENGKLAETGKFDEIRSAKEEATRSIPQGADNSKFLHLIRSRRPDVIGVSGFSPETKKLHKELSDILEAHEQEDKANREANRRPDDSDDDEEDKFTRPDVVMVNDEVARLFYTSDRAIAEFPNLPPLGRYCVALGRYLRSPILEYASLGADITSIKFDANQELVPADKLAKQFESAMVETVNMVGLDLESALSEPYLARLLPYVAGLGPRKAARLVDVINQNGGIVTSRKELLGDEESNIVQACGPVVWQNCASFLYLTYQEGEPSSDPLDNTRIHPEDYDIALKIAGDAMGMDEEDIAYERRTGGASAEVRKLLKEHQEDSLQDLQLENYAEELEQKFGQKKRAALETIRAELMAAYEELRPEFAQMSVDDIFTMLTGETKESLHDGMIVPVKIKRVQREFIECRLDCGVEGGVNQGDYSNNVADPSQARDYYAQGQTYPAKLLFLNRAKFNAQLTFREELVKRPLIRTADRLPGDWDTTEEAEDQRRAVQERESKTGRAHRVIKHPLFRPFNSAQAEEYLGTRNAGDVVIRPSSRGLDHLAITWKVADNVFQHIDVLELDKENEMSVGKTLRISGRYSYSDLDDLIVNHIESMAKKVTEMTADGSWQNKSLPETGELRLPFGMLCANTDFDANRTMVNDLYTCQPEACHVCLLHQSQASRLLQFML